MIKMIASSVIEEFNEFPESFAKSYPEAPSNVCPEPVSQWITNFVSFVIESEAFVVDKLIAHNEIISIVISAVIVLSTLVAFSSNGLGSEQVLLKSIDDKPSQIITLKSVDKDNTLLEILSTKNEQLENAITNAVGDIKDCLKSLVVPETENISGIGHATKVIVSVVRDRDQKLAHTCEEVEVLKSKLSDACAETAVVTSARDVVIESLREELASLRSDMTFAQNETKLLSESKQELEELLNQKGQIQAENEIKISSLQHEIEQLAASSSDRVQMLEVELKQAASTLLSMTSDRDALQESIASINHELIKARELNHQLANDDSERSSALSTLLNENARLRSELESSSSQTTSLSNQMEAFKTESTSSIQALESTLSELQMSHATAIASQVETEAQLIQTRNELTVQLEALEGRIAGISLQSISRLQEISDLQHELEAKCAELSTCQAEKAAIEQELLTLSQRVSELELDVQGLKVNLSRTSEELKSSRADEEARINELNLLKIELETDKTALQLLDKRYQTLKGDYATQSERLANLLVEKQSLEQENHSLEHRVAELLTELGHLSDMSAAVKSEVARLERELEIQSSENSLLRSTNHGIKCEMSSLQENTAARIATLNKEHERAVSELLASKTKTSSELMEQVEQVNALSREKIRFQDELQTLKSELAVSKSINGRLEEEALVVNALLCKAVEDKTALSNEKEHLRSEVKALKLELQCSAEAVAQLESQLKGAEEGSSSQHERLSTVLSEKMALATANRKLESKLQDLQAIITQRTELIQSLEGEHAALNNELEATKAELSQSALALQRVESELQTNQGLLVKTSDSKNAVVKERDAMRVEISALQVEIATYKDNIELLESKLQSMADGSSTQQDRLSQLLAEKQALAQSNRKLEAQVNDLTIHSTHIASTLSALEIEKTEVDQQVLSLQSQVAQMGKDYDTVSQECDSLRAKTQALSEDLQRSQHTVNALELRLAGMEQGSASQSDLLASLIADKSSAEELSNELRARVSEIAAQVKNQQQVIEELEATNLKLSSDLEQSIAEAQQVRESKKMVEIELSSKNEKLVQLEVTVSEVSTCSAEELEETRRQLSEQVKSFEQQLCDAEAVVAEKTAVIESLTAENVQANTDIAALKAAVDQAQGELQQAIATRTLLENQYQGNIQSLQDRYNELEDVRRICEETIDQLRTELSEATGKLAHLEQQVKPLQEQIDELTATMETKDQIIHRFETCDLEVERVKLVLERQSLFGKMDSLVEQLENSRSINAQLREAKDFLQERVSLHDAELKAACNQRDTLYNDITALKAQYDALMESQMKSMTTSFTKKTAELKIENEELKKQIASYRNQTSDAAALIAGLEVEKDNLGKTLSHLRQEIFTLSTRKPSNDVLSMNDVFLAGDFVNGQNPIYSSPSPQLTPEQLLRNQLLSMKDCSDQSRRDLIALHLEYGMGVLLSPMNGSGDDEEEGEGNDDDDDELDNDEEGDDDQDASSKVDAASDIDFGICPPLGLSDANFTGSGPNTDGKTGGAGNDGTTSKSTSNKNIITKLYKKFKSDIMPKGLMKKGKKRGEDLSLRVVETPKGNLNAEEVQAQQKERMATVEKKFFSDVFVAELDDSKENKNEVDANDLNAKSETDCTTESAISAEDASLMSIENMTPGSVRRTSMYLQSSKLKHPLTKSRTTPQTERPPLQAINANSPQRARPKPSSNTSWVQKAVIPRPLTATSGMSTPRK